jgi:phage terminase large subunit-like protein
MSLTVTPDEADVLRYLYRRERALRPLQRATAAHEHDWRTWMATVFPQFDTFAPHHAEFWDWLWQIERGTRPDPFVGIWGRGGWKSGSAELGAVALGALGKRTYGLYISGTQEQAEAHLDSVAAWLSTPGVAAHYPQLANPAVNRFGSIRGWRRNRVVTEAGFVIDAVGLRTGTRGIKFEDQRPDFIVLDDVDELDDTAETTAKKIHTFTHTLLPAGSSDLATIAIQNLIIPDGLFARLAPGAQQPASWLSDRKVSGPIPAIEDLEYEEYDDERTGARRVRITGGTATWQGQNLDTAQQQMNDWGIESFIAEAQHDPRKRGAKLYDLAWWDGQARYSIHDDALLRRVVARFQSWDTASSLSDTAAYSACVTGDMVAYRGGYALLIRDVWRDRVEFTQLTDAIEKQARKWGFDVAPRPHDRIVVEYASSGIAAVQTIKSLSATVRANAPTWLAPYVDRFPPLGSKDARSASAAVYARAGRVWLPEPDAALPFNLLQLESELRDVPNATYRDMTDALANLVSFTRAWLREPQQQQEAA